MQLALRDEETKNQHDGEEEAPQMSRRRNQCEDISWLIALPLGSPQNENKTQKNAAWWHLKREVNLIKIGAF